MAVIGLHFKVVDFIGLSNLKVYSQNEVCNIGTLVLWRDPEKTLLNRAYSIETGNWLSSTYISINCTFNFEMH